MICFYIKKRKIIPKLSLLPFFIWSTVVTKLYYIKIGFEWIVDFLAEFHRSDRIYDTSSKIHTVLQKLSHTLP